MGIYLIPKNFIQAMGRGVKWQQEQEQEQQEY